MKETEKIGVAAFSIGAIAAVVAAWYIAPGLLFATGALLLLIGVAMLTPGRP